MALFDNIPPFTAANEKRKKPKMKTKEVTGLVIGTGEHECIVDPETIWKMAVIGCTDVEIAEWHGITLSTLRFNFKEYIAQARSSLKQRLRKKQIDVALEGNVTMLIWLGKNMLDQSDTPRNPEESEPLPWVEDDSVGQ